MMKKPSLHESAAIVFSGMALSVLAFSAQALPVIMNGSFEDQTTSLGGTFVGPSCTSILAQCVSIPNWTTTSALTAFVTPTTMGTYMWQPTVTSPDGGNFLASDGSFGVGTLTQTLHNLVPGQSYNLTFWQAAAQLIGNNGPTLEQWHVTIGGSLQFQSSIPLPDGSTYPGASIVVGADDQWTTPVMSNPNQGFVPWQHESFTFKATAADVLLGFLALGSPIGPPPLVLLDGVSVLAVPEPETLALLGVSLLGMLLARRRQ